MFILYNFIQLLSVYPIIQIVNAVVVTSLSPCDRFKIKNLHQPNAFFIHDFGRSFCVSI